MPRIKTIATFIFSLFPVLLLHATDYPVKYLGIEQGLSNNAITCIYQDYRGFMWVATYDGLNRFDGYNFKVFRNTLEDNNSLSNNNVTNVAGDGKHNIWVGGLDGVNVLDPVTSRFTIPRYKSPYNGKLLTIQREIQTIKAIDQSCILIGSRRHGLFAFNSSTAPGVQVLLHTSSGTKDNYQVYAIEYDRKRNKVWVSIKQEGLFLYDVQKKRLELVDNTQKMAYCLKTDPQGNLWIGNDNGLFLYDVSSHRISENIMPGRNNVVSLCLDKQQVLWIGSDGAGVWRLLPGATQPLPFDAVNSNVAYSIYEDVDGRKWIGTLRGGLNVVDSRALPFKKISCEVAGKSNGIDNFILSFCEDNKKNVWIGTDGAGLRYWDRNRNIITAYRHDPANKSSISSNFITNLVKDTQGDIWISAWFGGINRLRKNSNTFERYVLFNTRTSTEEHNAWLVYEDAQKNIWAGTTNDGSLYKLNRAQNRFELFDPGISNLQSITEDKAGNLWGGSYTSLIKIDRIHRRHKVYPIGYPVRSIHEDRNGTLWLGTQGAGLLLFDRDNGTFRRYTMANGLPSNTILRILEDSKGDLWLSTYNGLARFNPATVTSRNFTQSDGLQSNQFSFNAALALSTGEFLFGGIKGFNIFHPDSVADVKKAPAVFLTGLRIDNKPLEEDDSYITGRSMETIQEIVLPYDKAVLSLDFIGLDYTGPDKIKYAYYLDGWDKDWNYVNNIRTANYSRLQEGKYIFKVKTTSTDGTWANSIELLRITVLPPWYRSWWAYCLCAISLLSVIYAYIWYTRRQERYKYEIKLAHLENEKDKELTERKISFFTNISHELRTPLSLIINPLKDRVGQSDDMELTVAYRNARRLLSLVDQLLLFRKADSGEDVLKISQVNVIELCRGVYQCFIQQARARKICYQFIAPVELPLLYIDEEKIEIALFNLLSNAFKFTKDGGNILLEVTENELEAMIIVKDDGCGIEEAARDRIFEKFGQAGAYSIQKAGFGIGLYLVKYFVDSHKGRVSYESKLHAGTSFTISLQKGNTHLPAAAILREAGTQHELLEELAVETGPQLPVISTSFATGKTVEEVVTDKRSILLVDDSREILDYLQYIFAGQYVLYMAEDGRQGLELAAEYLPDLIISDVNMGGLDGVEMCRIIKQTEKLGHIPVILLTAATDEKLRLRGVEGGADDYITKPFDNDLLLARVTTILRNRNHLQRYFLDSITLKESTVKVPAEYQEFLRRCIQVVEENLDADDFNIKKFARAMGMSHSGLYNKIKTISGQSPNAFIRSIRLRRAAVLMLSEDMNVSQSATYVGIGDIRYFREQFVKLFGITPSEYIKKYRHSFINTFNTIKIKGEK